MVAGAGSCVKGRSMTDRLKIALAQMNQRVGALRANEGQQWNPPLTPSFVK